MWCWLLDSSIYIRLNYYSQKGCWYAKTCHHLIIVSKLMVNIVQKCKISPNLLKKFNLIQSSFSFHYKQFRSVSSATVYCIEQYGYNIWLILLIISNTQFLTRGTIYILSLGKTNYVSEKEKELTRDNFRAMIYYDFRREFYQDKNALINIFPLLVMKRYYTLCHCETLV